MLHELWPHNGLIWFDSLLQKNQHYTTVIQTSRQTDRQSDSQKLCNGKKVIPLDIETFYDYHLIATFVCYHYTKTWTSFEMIIKTDNANFSSLTFRTLRVQDSIMRTDACWLTRSVEYFIIFQWGQKRERGRFGREGVE